MHRSRLTILAVTGLLLLACPGKNRPETPLTPWPDALGDSLAFCTVATDPQGGQLAYVFDWGYDHYDTTGWYDSGDTAWACHEFHIARACEVRARAFNAEGHWSDWSVPMVYLPSGPPALADTFFGPWWWGRDRWARYSATVADPDGDSVYVRFDWGDGRRSAWLGPVPSGGTATDSVQWPADSVYLVSVTLRDQRGTITPAAGTRLVKVSLMAVLWCFVDLETGYASPLLRWQDGRQYFITDPDGTDSLVCYDSDGNTIWQTRDVMHDVDLPFALSENGRRVYVIEQRMSGSAVVCLDAETGRTMWRYPGLSFDGTLALGPDGAICAVDYGKCSLVRLTDDGDSARLGWELRLAANRQWQTDFPVVGPDGVVYLPWHPDTSMYSVLLAVSPGGSVQWEVPVFPNGTWSDLAPVVDGDGRIILTDDEAGVSCYRPDGTLAWSRPDLTDCGPNTMAVGTENRLYVVYAENQLLCLNSVDGTVDWRSDWSRAYGLSTPLILEDGLMLLFDGDWQLYALNEEGVQLWQYCVWDSLGLPSPGRRAPRDDGDYAGAVAIGNDGNLYLNTGSLGPCCISFGNARIADTPWPTYNHDQARSGWAGRR